MLSVPYLLEQIHPYSASPTGANTDKVSQSAYSADEDKVNDDLGPKRRAQQERYEEALDIITGAFLIFLICFGFYKLMNYVTL